MEQPLRTLFALDLWAGPNVRFRPLVFLLVFALGAISAWALYINLNSLTIYPRPLANLDLTHVLIALGLIAALLSFKWEKAGP